MREHPLASANRRRNNNPAPANPVGAFNLLKKDLRQALRSENYQKPTPVQEQCIPLVLEGRDLIGSAQTGTGKTAAFTLPLLQILAEEHTHTKSCTPRALILAPTRELAAQIGKSIETYGKFTRLTHTIVFGGVNQFHQVKALKRGVDILVATPGRLLDLKQQGLINFDRISHFILDEVDRMLDMGFIPDINRILKMLPEQRQTLFFSATLSPKIEQIARAMLNNPARITIEPEKPAVERIRQTVFFVDQNDKEGLLSTILNNTRMKKTIIFTQMKHHANRVAQKLERKGLKATAIHGNKSQAARTKALEGFKKGQFNILVATDVAARGLDVDDVSHVINYDLPMEAETYVHRIGRTARAGAEGDAISFCSAAERAGLSEVEKLLKKPIPYELDHEFHSESAFLSRQGAPRRRGGGGGGGSRVSNGIRREFRPHGQAGDERGPKRRFRAQKNRRKRMEPRMPN